MVSGHGEPVAAVLRSAEQTTLVLRSTVPVLGCVDSSVSVSARVDAGWCGFAWCDFCFCSDSDSYYCAACPDSCSCSYAYFGPCFCHVHVPRSCSYLENRSYSHRYPVPCSYSCSCSRPCAPQVSSGDYQPLAISGYQPFCPLATSGSQAPPATSGSAPPLHPVDLPALVLVLVDALTL